MALPTSLNVIVPSGVNETSSSPPEASVAPVSTMSSPSGSRQRSSSRICVFWPEATVTASFVNSVGGWFTAFWSADTTDRVTCPGCADVPPRPSEMLYENVNVPLAFASTTACRPAPPRTSWSVTPGAVVGALVTVMMSPSGSESLSRIVSTVDRPARTVSWSSLATGGRFFRCGRG